MDNTVANDGKNSVKLSKFISVTTDSFAAERLEQRKTFQDDMMVEIDLSLEEEEVEDENGQGDEVGRVVDAMMFDKKKSGQGIKDLYHATRRNKGTSSKQSACKWMGLALTVVFFVVLGYCLSIVLLSDDRAFTSDDNGNATSPAHGSIVPTTSPNSFTFDDDKVEKNDSTQQNLNQSGQVICLEDNDMVVLCGMIIEGR